MRWIEMKMNIIILDDDSFEIQVLTRAINLVLPNSSTNSFQQAKDAITFLKNIVDEGSKLPDMIFSDIKMPATSGFNFLEDVQNLLADRVPVVMCSGSDDSEDREKAMSLGAVEYLVKDFDAKMFAEKLGRVFSKHLS
jgi:CheY-like chemotaxis protein